MSNKIYQVYTEMPTWAKGIVVVGGLAVIYFTGNKIWRSIQAKRDLADEKATLRETESELSKLSKSGFKPSYLPSVYKNWADTIEKQFNGIECCGNSYTKVKNIIKLFKDGNFGDADYLALVSAYAIRTYDQAGWSFGIGTGDFTGTLNQAITDELNSTEIKLLNDILASKKITYKFS